jgi:hypothetical protein
LILLIICAALTTQTIRTALAQIDKKFMDEENEQYQTV